MKIRKVKGAVVGIRFLAIASVTALLLTVAGPAAGAGPLQPPDVPGSVVGWGSNYHGQADSPDGNDYVAIAAGHHYSLALKSDGSVVGWGYNLYEQTDSPDGNDYVAIAAGGYHGLALKSDGSVVGWGSNYHGQATPPDGNDYVAIAGGMLVSLALKSDGSVVGWGWNDTGQTNSPTGNDYVAIAAGNLHSLALKSDGSVVGWGYNDHGQATPPDGHDYVAIAAGYRHSLALKSDGSVVGWGKNDHGQATPPDGNDYVAIAAGYRNSLALKSDGSVVGWGYNLYEQTDSPDGNDYVAIAAGVFHNLALKRTNQAPSLTADTTAITVSEGQQAANSGTVSDPDGDEVTLVASAGSVIENSNGTWSWSFDTLDGPADSRTVTISADDGKGGTAETSFDLTVENVAPTVGAITVSAAVVPIGAEVTFGASFTDPGVLDTHTALWDWESVTSSGVVTGSGGSGTVSGSHVYSDTGVYTITLAVTDNDGGVGTSIYQYVVVYDPSAGFVTGGGWIMSPAGAYAADPDLTGKATFGFVSKYKKGASVPTGNTQFQFRAGELNFHSDTQQWLVVNQDGRNAQFKCTGTINGDFGPGSEPFDGMIWAGDGTGPDGQDTFRIKIWYSDNNGTEIVVYDNAAHQPIGGGSVVVHTK